MKLIIILFGFLVVSAFSLYMGINDYRQIDPEERGGLSSFIVIKLIFSGLITLAILVVLSFYLFNGC